MSHYPLSIGKKIRLARSHRNMRQIDLAAEVGLHETILSFIESGRMNPTAEQIQAIEAALGLSFDDPQVEAAFAILAGQGQPAPATKELIVSQELPNAR